MIATPSPTALKTATAALVVAHISAFAGLWIFVWLLHRDSISTWYVLGGPFMPAVVGASVVQLVGSTVAATVHLRRPLPLLLHFVGPLLPLVIGFVGTAVSLSAASTATSLADLGDLANLWAATLAEADGPRQLGVMAAALGCAPLVVTGALTGFLRRDVETNTSGPFAGLVVGGAGVMTGLAAFGLLVGTSYGRFDLLLLCWLCAGLIFAGVVMAFGAPGLASLSVSTDPATRAVAFDAAVLCTLAAVATLGLHALAVVLDAQADALRTLVTAPDNTRVGLVAGAGLAVQIARRAVPLLAAAALLVGLMQLSNTLGGAQAWLRRRSLWTAACLVLLLAVIGADSMLGRRRDATHATVMTRLWHGADTPLALAESSSSAALRPTDGRLVMTRGLFTAWGKSFDDPAAEEVGELMRQRILAAVAGRDAQSAGDSMCGDRLGEVTIVAPAALPARWVIDAMQQLADAGVCTIELAVTARPERDPDVDEQRSKVDAALHRLPLTADLLRSKEEAPKAVRFLLASSPAVGTPATERPPALSYAGGTVMVAAERLTTVRSTDNGRIDRVALAQHLAAVADERRAALAAKPAAETDGREIYLAVSGEAPLQALIDLADGARELRRDDGTVERLFDRPVILLR